MSTMGAAFFSAAEHDKLRKFMFLIVKMIIFDAKLRQFYEKRLVFLKGNDDFLMRRNTFSFKKTIKKRHDFRRYLARARARARTALVKRGASGPYPKKSLAFFLPARALRFRF